MNKPRIPTPRTDALADRFGNIDPENDPYWKALDLATELERELAARPEERRMTPKQLDALRMLNDAFESHDGAPVMQAIITRTDYRLLYEALAEGTAGDRIAQELLSPPSPQKETK